MTRVALCGAGMISVVHGGAARALGMPVTAVASRSHERSAERAAQLGGRPLRYEDLPGDADIVVVATPPAQHAGDALRALRAGRAVLVEKPLCPTLSEADALVDAAAAHGDRLLYGENLAYAPVVQAMLRSVGSLGPLTHLDVRSISPLPTWRDVTDPTWGGGALFDLGVHPLAVAVLLAGAAGAGQVVAVAGRLEGDRTDEHAEVDLTFASGLHGRVVASWRGGEVLVWDAEASSRTGVLRAELLPRPELARDGEIVVLPPTTVDPPAFEQYGYTGQLRALADDVAAGRRPTMDAGFGRWMLDIVCAASRSSAHGGAPEAVPFTGPRDQTPSELWRGG